MVTIKLLAHLTYQLGNRGELTKLCPCHGRNPLIARQRDGCRLSVSCGYEDDVSSGCCLFVQLWSSSHTYIAENVHDNNLCLYPFIMLVVDPLLPENAFFPLQFQSSFTYVILIFCIQFTYCSLNQKPKNISFTKYAFYPVTQNIIQYYFFSI